MEYLIKDELFTLSNFDQISGNIGSLNSAFHQLKTDLSDFNKGMKPTQADIIEFSINSK